MDLVNALFEMFGAFAAWSNVTRILKDKQVKGVDWKVTAFWSAWGVWNLFYYPHLDQPLSAIAAGFLTVANTLWVVLALKYSKHNSD